jgi:hypothetical protein
MWPTPAGGGCQDLGHKAHAHHARVLGRPEASGPPEPTASRVNVNVAAAVSHVRPFACGPSMAWALMMSCWCAGLWDRAGGVLQLRGLMRGARVDSTRRPSSSVANGPCAPQTVLQPFLCVQPLSQSRLSRPTATGKKAQLLCPSGAASV